MKRETVETYGPKRGGVRVIREGDAYLVTWRLSNGMRRYRSFPKTTDGKTAAKVWAKAFWHEKEHRKAPSVTVRELWDRYQAARFTLLRPRTQLLYAQRFRWWEDFLGRDASAESVSLEQIERFRKEQTVGGRAVNQIRNIVTVAKLVWSWGERAEIVTRNVLGRYRFELAKHESIAEPDAYEWAEYQAILSTLDPRTVSDWRPWCLLMLIGHQGIRANAALHLRWEDVDFDGGWVTWRLRWDKVGKEWTQPILAGAREALLVALGYGQRGGWVFPPAHDGKRKNQTYTIQALTDALHRAEDEAGVDHHPLRALHGLRRMVVNRVRRATDDPAAGLRFVGDTDLRQATSYVRVKSEELASIALILDTEGAKDAARAAALPQL